MGFFPSLVPIFFLANFRTKFITKNMFSRCWEVVVYIYKFSKIIEEKELIVILPDRTCRMNLWQLLLSTTLAFFYVVILKLGIKSTILISCGIQVFLFLFCCEMPCSNSSTIILIYPFLSKNFITIVRCYFM